jgi:signal transduction histidine kinase/HAMP domain-containing protein/ActR/RegA family two-component response regulator
MAQTVPTFEQPKGVPGTAASTPPEAELRRLLDALAAVRDGDFAVRLDRAGHGTLDEIAAAFNGVVERNQRLCAELVRVRRVVGGDGRLDERLRLSGGGAWSAAIEAANGLVDDLARPTVEVGRVLAAVADGNLSQKVDVGPGERELRGEFRRVATTANGLVDQLSLFTSEVTRVAREVGTEGKLGGQAVVPGVSGTWRDLTDSVNFMAGNLTAQVRNIAQVTTAVARGDLSKKITVDVEARGEILELKNTINTMVDQLSAFADEVTRVAREVGSEGRLGGQADVRGVSGTWKDLTDNVNSMASNLTGQVRNIALVTTAVARGDLSKKIDVDARGEILELKTTINTMVDQLSAFASEVTRVAREVGSEGRLGGQAEVEGVSGTWKRLTESVNLLAGNLTTQVRAIAEVATAVTRGDLTRQINVDASGEVADLKDNINRMIGNLRETTRANQQQDWLKTNLARISGMMQGRRDLLEVAQLIMNELTPAVQAQQAAFFLADQDEAGGTRLRAIAGYGGTPASGSPAFGLGESLVGQAALERRRILVPGVPAGYLRIGSGLGQAPPASIVIVPVLFEGQVLAVIELATFGSFSDLHLAFLGQLVETIGVIVNTIIANSRTEALLAESQRLAQQLQERSEQLQGQQEELRRKNTELEEKAALLAEQNRAIEVQNFEIEQARRTLEDRAEQLALSSKYKSEFLANMSHELRTPLNSLLVLARLLADNLDGNLTGKQVEFARVIHEAGSDLLQLINDILDLSKVEAGKMDLHPVDVPLTQLLSYVEATFRPLTVEKGLHFEATLDSDVPATLHTDEQRLQQVLRNLLSNAVKFTDTGGVRLMITRADGRRLRADAARRSGTVLRFSVTDTGVGIPGEALPEIFEAFQQGDGTTSRRYGGTGLGLSISREIAQLLGGELHATSEPGRGSTFTLYLPLVAPHGTAAGPSDVDDEPVAAGPVASAAPAWQPSIMEDGVPAVTSVAGTSAAGTTGADQVDVATAAVGSPAERAAGVVVDGAVVDMPAGSGDGRIGEPADRGRGRGRGRGRAEAQPEPWQGSDREAGSTELSAVLAGRQVLIVDDDVRNVFALTAVLEQQGMLVRYAENGRDAIAMLDHDPTVDLLLMDIMMPGMDGNATTRTIRARPEFAGLPIIALTAKAMAGDREKSREAGASDYVIKPVDVDHLLRVMATWLTDGTTRTHDR